MRCSLSAGVLLRFDGKKLMSRGRDNQNYGRKYFIETEEDKLLIEEDLGSLSQ